MGTARARKPSKSQSLKKRSTKSARTKVRVKQKSKGGRTSIPAAFFVALFIAGILLTIGGGSYLTYKRRILSFSAAPPPVSHSTEIARAKGIPQLVSIPKVGIETVVVPAQIVSGVWQVADHAANHLDTSARPSEDGNVVVYAHNTKALFGGLRQVRVGDEVVVQTDDGAQHRYVVKSIATVQPSNVSLVQPTTQEVLTLYTCVGFLDSQRLVVQATPVGA